jgi:hypothetical protein
MTLATVNLQTQEQLYCVITGFHREFDEDCALLGYFAATGGICLPTFQDSPSVPTSWVKNPK